MPKIKIDGIEFHSEDLSDAGRAKLSGLQLVKSQMQKINQEIAVYQMAKTGFTEQLKAELQATGKLVGAVSGAKADKNA